MTETEENDFQNPITINSNLIKKEEHKKYGNRFIEDYTYDITGDNGIFEIVPKIVKFSGFEINKSHKIKVQIINKSKFSESLTLIPPTTPFFKIKFSGNGIIPSGLSKSVTILFIPNKYQYYHDFIRVFCQGQKIQIPIHAYPRMNINKKEYLPKFIDFGVIGINSSETKEIILDNLLPINFEYEIIPIKTTPEIIVEPLFGDIEAESNKIIYIKFTPLSYGIFVAEYEFKHSEYDFKNIRFQISGSCNTFDKVNNEIINKKKTAISNKASLREKQTLSSQNPNLLQSIKTVSEKTKINMNNGTEKIPKNGDSINNRSFSSISKDKGISKKYKIFPSNKEREFLNYFNTIDSSINDKEIKYIRFIGKKLLTNDETNKIIKDRIEEYENNLQVKRRVDVNRHDLELNTETCTLDPNHKFFIKSSFDFNSNDKFYKKRHYFKLFLKYMTAVVVRARAEKRTKCLREMISKNNIQSSNDFAEYVEKDWHKYLTQDNESEEYKVKLKFVKPKTIVRKELYISYDYNLDSLKQPITHDNYIQFDELKEYQYLDKSDLEVMNYKEFKSPGLTMYEISTKEKNLRSGAEGESYLRGERGDSEMEFGKIESLIEMPKTMKNHIKTNIETLLFNNPGLKKYALYNTFYESAIEYNLQPRNLNMGYVKENHYSHYAYDMNMKIPFSIYDFLPNRDLDNSCMVCDKSLDKVPKRLEAADPKDFLIKVDEKIDDDNYLFNQIKDDDNKLLDGFEAGDEVVKRIRELNKEGVYDIKMVTEQNLQYNHSIQKRKWMTTVPTILEYYNSGIINPNNKTIL